MKSYQIATIGGDGTGPEVIAEAIKVLNSLPKDVISFQFTDLPYNGTRYLKTGETLSDHECAALQNFDAILLGAIGHPDIKPGILEREILLKMRFQLDLFINYRPVKLYPNVETPLKSATPETIDYVVIRENTGGLYTGKGSCTDKGTPNEMTTQIMEYSYAQVERCIRYAFQVALARQQQGKPGRVTLCGKTNVLTYVYDLWERVLKAVNQDFPTITSDYVHVDAVCIYMIECPEKFDVIVTGNMFGDIITDLAATTQGGMGVAGSGNINPYGVSMFEPIGGTAPAFTGKNEINPIAAISAAHLMLEHLGEHKWAKQIENAKQKTIAEMKSMQAGKMGLSTTEVGDRVVTHLTHACVTNG